MREWYSNHGPSWWSRLRLTEAARRSGRLTEELLATALDTAGLVLPSVTTCFAVVQVPCPGLPSLDALHLANAPELGADLKEMVVYDLRLRACPNRRVQRRFGRGAVGSGGVAASTRSQHPQSATMALAGTP